VHDYFLNSSDLECRGWIVAHARAGVGQSLANPEVRGTSGLRGQAALSDRTDTGAAKLSLLITALARAGGAC
jgi:hypothetical protein